MSVSNYPPIPIAKNNSKPTVNKSVSPITIVNRNKVIKNNEQISDNEKVLADDWTVIPTVLNKKDRSPLPVVHRNQNNRTIIFLNRLIVTQPYKMMMNSIWKPQKQLYRPHIVPPTIFIKTKIDYQKFCTAIKLLIDSTKFTCKSNI